ncbi:MAG: L-threonylcarbamoyladenylate synthase [Patescibacteria group bacterium]
MDNTISDAIVVLSQGGIVIFPTDTAFGIGCRIDRSASVDRLFRLRKRPLTQAMPVLVDSEVMALPYFDHPNDIVRRLMETHWPGALTIVSACTTGRLYSPIRGGTNTVGMRMPDHDGALSLIRGVGIPILGPSANFHGNPTPFRFEDLDTELTRLVDYVVPGVCSAGVASTVVDATRTPATIVRQGAIVLKPGELI